MRTWLKQEGRGEDGKRRIAWHSVELNPRQPEAHPTRSILSESRRLAYRLIAGREAKRFPQQRETLRDRGTSVFATFELQRYVASVAHTVQDGGDAIVVEIECIPGAAAVIGFGLDEDGLGRQLLEFRIGILEKIASVHGNAQPWRVDHVDDAEYAFWSSSQPPVVLES